MLLQLQKNWRYRDTTFLYRDAMLIILINTSIFSIMGLWSDNFKVIMLMEDADADCAFQWIAYDCGCFKVDKIVVFGL